MARKTAIAKRLQPVAAPSVEVVQKGMFDELGATGLQRTGKRGLVDEEFLPELRGERATRVYREMRDNDSVIGAIMYAIEMLIRNAKWDVRKGKDEHREFVQSCFEDMSTSFEDLLAEILSMLTFGWSWHEIVYKKREGMNANPSRRSKFNDGRIGWRKMPIRAQETLNEWVWDEEGGIQAMQQLPPPEYNVIEIPINRSLLFRAGVHKGNPEGRSILRNCYRPWWFKQKLEVIEGIGVERDLAGLPVIYRDGSVAKQYDTELKKIVTNVRRDEQEGILLPLAYDENGNQLCKFELLSSAGNRQMDVDKIIQRYDQRIAITVMADFILLGHEKVGSFALSSSKTHLFSLALGAIAESIASVFNQHAIPRLFALNGIKAEELPQLVLLDIESPDLGELGQYITQLAGAGMPLFPDDQLEGYLRSAAGLPEKPEEGIQPPEVAAPELKAPPKQKKPTAPKAKKPEKPAPAKPDTEQAEEESSET